MLVDSKSLIVNTSAENLFNFLSKEENLPKWAIHYCKGVRKEGDDYIITTPHGDMFYEVEADAKTGVVDMKSGPTKDQMMAFPARVSPLPDGTSIFNLTCILMEEMSDEELEGLQQAFKEEFDALAKAVA
ncbi:hypothetical protein RYZ26_00620 [Terasakiella sp. A23]|uniref:hypothetical protein n=1 Tax=Terasakiella sp. FCG-A23 TaxID=3080561 RepID=UPI002952E86C|nr:hypothetical protein [Terasakiella sp. A23]MDV7338077.1 hypothetical protein [Terasakiella sp. A23]